MKVHQIKYSERTQNDNIWEKCLKSRNGESYERRGRGWGKLAYYIN